MSDTSVQRVGDASDDDFDQIASDLRSLRERAGAPSYAEIVRRITRLRLMRGVPAAAATPARSTVYNAFQDGRRWINAELVRDIALALGEGSDAAEAWVRRCVSARLSREAVRRESPEPQTESAAPLAAPQAKRSAPFVVLVLACCIAINLLGLWLTSVFKLTVYLDMVGTAIAAITFGPWPGVAVALASSNLGFVVGDENTTYFTAVNLVGALLWGYGTRRLGLGRTFTRYVLLNVVVAVGCTFFASPIIVLGIGDASGHSSFEAVASLEALGIPTIASTFSANIVTSIMDKLLTAFITLLVVTIFLRDRGTISRNLPFIDALTKRTVARTAFGPWGGIRTSQPAY